MSLLTTLVAGTVALAFVGLFALFLFVSVYLPLRERDGRDA